MASLRDQLRGLVLSATELKQLNPGWSDSMTEDYLNIFENFLLIANTEGQNSASIELLLSVVFAEFQEINSDTVIDDNYGLFDIDTTAGDVRMTLPDRGGSQKFVFRKANQGGGSIIIDAGTNTLNGHQENFISGFGNPSLTVSNCTDEWGYI
jgi:hypothetical protein